MKTNLLSFLCVIGVGAILCGCGDSKSSSAGGKDETTATSAAASVAPKTVAAVKAAASEMSSQFVEMAKSQSDKVLGSIATDLKEKVTALAASTGTNSAVKSQVDSSLQSLMSGKESAGLGTLYQAAQTAGLTPQQVGLAKEVGNLASAFVVQKNFASLDGAQGDVATLVNSLRKGDLTTSVQALQKVGQSANLTSAQKDVIGSLANQYAPGLKKAADSVQQGLQGLKGLGK
jgi:hypothetical protein